MQLIRRAMTNRGPLNVPLAIGVFAAMAVAALRAAARRPEPRLMPGGGPASATATAEVDRPQPVVTAGRPRTAGGETAKPPPAGRPDGSAEQMQYVFHELHAEGQHALCQVCPRVV